MSSNRPETILQLMEFYYNVFKPLYAHMQIINSPPLEMFFEMNAAFDHLSRHWKYGEDEKQAVNHASAHLKRGCFDAFKIVARDAREDFERLRKVDTSIIDNGQFDLELIGLFKQIRIQAIEARRCEGDSRDKEIWHNAFDLWFDVYRDIQIFYKKFYYSKNVEWARRKQRKSNWYRRGEGFVMGIVVTITCNLFGVLKTFVGWIFKTYSGN